MQPRATRSRTPRARAGSARYRFLIRDTVALKTSRESLDCCSEWIYLGRSEGSDAYDRAAESAKRSEITSRDLLSKGDITDHSFLARVAEVRLPTEHSGTLVSSSTKPEQHRAVPKTDGRCARQRVCGVTPFTFHRSVCAAQ